jgi:hypothetical protein
MKFLSTLAASGQRVINTISMKLKIVALCAMCRKKRQQLFLRRESFALLFCGTKESFALPTFDWSGRDYVFI